MFNFDSAIKKINPFPYLLFEKVFKDDFFQNLMNEFPSEDYYKKLILTQGGRFDFGRWNKQFYDFLTENSNWNKLYSYVQSEDFIKKILKIFQSSLDELSILNPNGFSFSNKIIGYERKPKIILNAILQSKYFLKILDFLNNKEPLAVSFNITIQQRGYNSPPHIDSRHKICAFLIYLDDCFDDGFLRLYKTNGIPDKNGYLKSDEVDEINKFLPKKNKGILIFNNKKSAHSAEFIQKNPNSKRSFVYISIASARRKDVWK